MAACEVGNGVKLTKWDGKMSSWVWFLTETINADPKTLFVTAELRLKCVFYAQDFIPGSMRALKRGGGIKLTKWDGIEQLGPVTVCNRGAQIKNNFFLLGFYTGQHTRPEGKGRCTRKIRDGNEQLGPVTVW